MPANFFVPPPAERALLGPEIDAACAHVESLAARLEDAQQRAGKWGPLAENPDRHHLARVRAAVENGGSSADVPDERGLWTEQYRQAREDVTALRPMLDAAWIALQGAMVKHRGEAVAPVDSVITAAAQDYAAALDDVERAEAKHRAAMTLRTWLGTADRRGGPDPYRPDRQTAADGQLTPAQALAALRADVDALGALREAERKAKARADYEAKVAADRRAAATAREQQERTAAERLAATRAATREREVAETAAAEARQIPGTPAA